MKKILEEITTDVEQVLEDVKSLSQGTYQSQKKMTIVPTSEKNFFLFCAPEKILSKYPISRFKTIDETVDLLLQRRKKEKEDKKLFRVITKNKVNNYQHIVAKDNNLTRQWHYIQTKLPSIIPEQLMGQNMTNDRALWLLAHFSSLSLVQEDPELLNPFNMIKNSLDEVLTTTQQDIKKHGKEKIASIRKSQNKSNIVSLPRRFEKRVKKKKVTKNPETFSADIEIQKQKEIKKPHNKSIEEEDEEMALFLNNINNIYDDDSTKFKLQSIDFDSDDFGFHFPESEFDCNYCRSDDNEYNNTLNDAQVVNVNDDETNDNNIQDLEIMTQEILQEKLLQIVESKEFNTICAQIFCKLNNSNDGILNMEQAHFGLVQVFRAFRPETSKKEVEKRVCSFLLRFKVATPGKCSFSEYSLALKSLFYQMGSIYLFQQQEQEFSQTQTNTRNESESIHFKDNENENYENEKEENTTKIKIKKTADIIMTEKQRNNSHIPFHVQKRVSNMAQHPNFHRICSELFNAYQPLENRITLNNAKTAYMRMLSAFFPGEENKEIIENEINNITEIAILETNDSFMFKEYVSYLQPIFFSLGCKLLF